jgi:hypothetical protein
MKRISVSSKSRVLNGLLKRALKENIIIRARDGHEFVLAEIEDFNREIELIRQNDKLMKLLDERGQEKATISLREARRRLRVA